jgi:hypothetical protein
MFVPSYQMHNVLNVYSRQLRQTMASNNAKKKPAGQPADQANSTSGGKREATIEKVSKDIVDKITKFGSLKEARHRTTERTSNKTVVENEAVKEKKSTFVFNVIDDINKKITNTISVEDPSFLIRQFEQIAEDSEEKKTESWV